MKYYSKPEFEAIAQPSQVVLDMSTEAGFEFSSVADLEVVIVQSLLRSWHTNGIDKEADVQVEKAWTEIFNYGFNNANPDDDMTPLGILGPPGQGKTSVFSSAIKRIGKAMENRVLINPGEYVKVDKDDIVFRTIIMAGEVSNTVVSGVPQISPAVGVEKDVTRFAPPEYLAKLEDNRFSVIVVDDLLNAHSHIQNAMMDLIETRHFRSTYIGETAYTAFTGNLGAIDGTNVNKQSSALTNRARSMVTGDTPGDFCERAHRTYVEGRDDNFGTGFIIEFLVDNVERNPLLFYEGVDKKKNGPHTSSRSLEKLIRGLRDEMNDHDAALKAGARTEPIFMRFERIVPQYVGKTFTNKFLPYVQDLLTLARPVANELLEHGTLSEQTRAKFQNALASSDDVKVERLCLGLLRQLQSRVANDIFYGMQGIIPPAKRAVNPDLDEVSEKRLVSEGKTNAAKSLHAFCEACFGVGMINKGKQNLVMNAFVALTTELIEKSNNIAGAKTSMFGTLDSNKQPIASKAFFKGLVEVASKFDKSYKSGEAMTVVNQVKGKKVTALETCLIDPLSAVNESEKIAEEAAKLGIVT